MNLALCQSTLGSLGTLLKSNKRSMSRNVEMTEVTNEKDRVGSLSLLVLLSILRVHSDLYMHIQ